MDESARAELFNVISLSLTEVERKDKRFKWYIIAVIIGSILLYSSMLHCFGDAVWIDKIGSAVLAIMITAFFSLLGKYGALAPIERRLELLNNGMKEAIRLQTESNYKLEQAISVLSGYSKYENARFKFGFNSIDNINVEPDFAAGGVKISSSHLAFNVIERAQEGDVVRYMTTYLGENVDYLGAIQRAIMRGVKIKIFLMLPLANAPVVKARLYTVSRNDLLLPFDESATLDDRIRAFVSYIEIRAKILTAMRDHLREKTSTKGELEVRFYFKSLHFPLIYVESPQAGGTIDVVCYTGFYAARNAEEMPYIEWRGGDYKICEKFKKVWDDKWHDCRAFTNLPTEDFMI